MVSLIYDWHKLTNRKAIMMLPPRNWTRHRSACLARLGMIYRSQGKYDEAINTFRQITGLGKDQASQGEGLIVETLQLEGQPQKAMQEAEEALKKYPNNRSL